MSNNKKRVVGFGIAKSTGVYMAWNAETLYTCDRCGDKFLPEDARWVGALCLCPTCHPEPTQSDQ